MYLLFSDSVALVTSCVNGLRLCAPLRQRSQAKEHTLGKNGQNAEYLYRHFFATISESATAGDLISFDDNTAIEAFDVDTGDEITYGLLNTKSIFDIFIQILVI